MDEDRFHRAVSVDGTQLVSTVRGEGPALVLVHGGMDDGELCWAPMLPYLARHFTCYAMSTRGRGRSGDAADVSPERLVEDVVAVVDSVGEPVRLLGESDGGALALAASASTAAVAALAVYEPAATEVVHTEVGARIEETLGGVAAAVEEGRPEDAARILTRMLANDDEMAALEASGHFEETARYIPVQLEELDQATASAQLGPTHPSVLAAVSVPVLVLRGTRTALPGWLHEAARYVEEHVDDVRVRDVAGAGHFGVTLTPEPIAEEVIRFFDEVAPA